ncbi:hypothetical protein EDB19DRAFT_1627871, partial [Suillus lakei]
DECIHFRRIMFELCPLGHEHHRRALDELSRSLYTHFAQRGSISDIDESIQIFREAVSLCLEGHPDRNKYLNELAGLLGSRFEHQGKSHDLDEAISLYEETLRLRPIGHESRDVSLDNLGSQLGAGQGTVLAAVDSELGLVSKFVPPQVKFTNLFGEEATQAGALEALERNT